MASCIGTTYVACTTHRKTGDTNCTRTEHSALCRHSVTIELADYSPPLVETNSGSCRSYCKGTTRYSCHSYPKTGDCVCAEEKNSSQCRVGDISIECGGNPIGSAKLTASLVGSVKAPLTSDTEEISAGQLRLALNESGHFLREYDIWKIDPRYSSINVSRQEFTIQAEDGFGETIRVKYPAEGGLFLRIGQSEMAANSICRVGKK